MHESNSVVIDINVWGSGIVGTKHTEKLSRGARQLCLSFGFSFLLVLLGYRRDGEKSERDSGVVECWRSEMVMGEGREDATSWRLRQGSLMCLEDAACTSILNARER